ncbi:tyrosine--tRNA ligase [Lyticum sinuosum]|uniref:Tyrosine--tRNA ligase n=1 Tax=Lyticum sinuosum TaxID=1332059 RepID=A0AAE4VM31_9RICK|nr:tyrosine--tRNA ligase [Lyticum sinuosum]MDZ5761079.1 Tyrosine--tRNA ligase [Lyticum sinuosum]
MKNINIIKKPQILSPFLYELQERGYIHQSTDLFGLNNYILENKKIIAYVGFDCTASSLHVGSLMQIMIMRKLQQHGHQPIIIFGGATTMIGDPSDKQEMRRMLSIEDIENNKKSISKVFYNILKFDGSNPAIILDNREWLSSIGYIEMLRQCGKYLSVNRMLGFDSVKTRLEREQQLSFLEFNYMVLQAYDFVELYRRHKCILQFGGSEQWGNIISGIDLGHKMMNIQLFGITTPLITTSDGKKMGKTAQGAVWLNADMLSPYDFWQFWRNTDDSDVEKFLKIYTDIPLEECKLLGKLEGKEINDAKIILANAVTTICHGNKATEMAIQTADNFFKNRIAGSGIKKITIFHNFQKESLFLYKLLVDCKLAKSNSSARQLIKGGGVSINDIIYKDEYYKINKDLITKNDDNEIKIIIGKKNCIIIAFGNEIEISN